MRPQEGSLLARGAATAFWTPGLITLAFLPDIASQAAIAGGSLEPTPVTHSLLLACGAAVLLAWALRRWAGMRWSRALLLATLLVPGHVLLDLLQSPWRAPLWPVSSAPIGWTRPLLPTTARGEALLSGLAFLVLLAARPRRTAPSARTMPTPRAAALGATAAIVLLAGLTHHLRGRREDRYSEALDRLVAGDAATALRLADEADRWPRPTRPGRIDYLRAEAHLAQRDEERAQRYLLRSLRADPDYFWAWADLCVSYAASTGPAEERRQKTLPCLHSLRTRFANHPDLERMAGRAERALSRASALAEPSREPPGAPGGEASGPRP